MASTTGAGRPSSLRPHPALSPDEQDTQRQLDACIDRMRAHTSDEPYILTVPQEEPKYHHYSRYLADAWLRNTPFSADEHPNIQYQTFFYHEPHSDVFQQHRHSHFETKTRPDAVAKTDAVASNASTPSLGPKKKISLAAYKNKQANSSAPHSADKHSPDHRRQTHAADDVSEARPKLREKARERERPHDDSTTSRDKETPAKKATAHNETKRKHDSVAPNSAHHVSPVAPKRVRASLPEAPQGKAVSPNRQHTRTPPTKASKRPELPDRLSPLHLPTRLSPTLPPKILASLESRNRNRSASGSSASDKQLQSAPQRPNSKHDSVLSDADKQKHTPKPAQRASSVHPEQQAPDRHSQSAGTTRDSTQKATLSAGEDRSDGAPHAPTQSLIVKLKIPKSHRSNIRRLLAMPPARKDAIVEDSTEAIVVRSDRAGHEKRSGELKDETTKGVARKVSAASRTLAKDPGAAVGTASKRPRLADGDASPPQSKRKKAPEDPKIEKAPRTPVQPFFESPALPSSAQKVQLTPAGHKDLRTSVSMKRVESADGPSSTPPLNEHTPSSKPGASTVQHANSTIRPSPSSNSMRTPESQAWQDEHARLGALGRELKHSLQGKKATESAALASLESFLAFILSFYCQERSLNARDPPLAPESANTWLTLHGFWNMVRLHCQPFPRLYGLASHLGVFYNGIILARLTGSKQSREPSVKDAKALQDAAATLTRAARYAEESLPLTAIISDFPQTWKRYLAQDAASAPADDHVRPGHYDGNTVLPLGTQTTPLQAVCTAHTLLSEWTVKKGSTYKMKLTLKN
ncbi:hypothetical protein MBLNU459_g4618t1 [Dothideomycetes sp. NU459]